MVVKVSNWYPSAKGMQTGAEDFAIQGRARLGMRRVAGSMMNKHQPNDLIHQNFARSLLYVMPWIMHTYIDGGHLAITYRAQ